MQYQAVVFDMDGVIFDTERLVIEFWKEVAKKHNIPNIEHTCIQCLGTNRVRTREIFLENYRTGNGMSETIFLAGKCT